MTAVKYLLNHFIAFSLAPFMGLLFKLEQVTENNRDPPCS